MSDLSAKWTSENLITLWVWVLLYRGLFYERPITTQAKNPGRSEAHTNTCTNVINCATEDMHLVNFIDLV